MESSIKNEIETKTIYNDYNHYYNVIESNYDFHIFLSSLSQLPPSTQTEKHIIKILKIGKLMQLEKRYKINKKNLIYGLLIDYATHSFLPKIFQKRYLMNPYILKMNLFGEQKEIETEYGTIHFSLYVPDIREVVKREKPFQHLRIFRGKTLGDCHHTSLKRVGRDDYVVTALIPNINPELELTHTYLEDKQKHIIYDVSRNLVFDTETFNWLVQPKVISKISYKELIVAKQLLLQLPRDELMKIDIREFLIEHNKIMSGAKAELKKFQRISSKIR
ncbi:MAG: hypothetical protein HFH47_02890 [Bacilli bacterium]|nr:hypothetical protein [Bacilli bacterium]